MTVSLPVVLDPTENAIAVPTLITAAGGRAQTRFLEFFTANIRNPNTRAAYWHAAERFLTWCDQAGANRLGAITPHHVATYIEALTRAFAAPTVKQHLAALRMLFDWLVVGQVMASNPAHAVRGPRHVVKRGKTPVLAADEARALFTAIDASSVVGLRDRALIAVLTYSFARISAALAMKVEDYYVQGRRGWIRLHEKGGKQHEMPCHHKLEEYLDAYIQTAGLSGDPKGRLFRSAIRRAGALSDRPLARQDAYRLVQRRAANAGIATRIGCHTFRATGITAYLENGGTLEHAQTMAAHESPRTTKLYDRTTDMITLDEVEKIGI